MIQVLFSTLRIHYHFHSIVSFFIVYFHFFGFSDIDFQPLSSFSIFFFDCHSLFSHNTDATPMSLSLSG